MGSNLQVQYMYSFFSCINESPDYKLFLWISIQNILFILDCKEKSLKNIVTEHVIKNKHFFHSITCVKEHE